MRITGGQARGIRLQSPPGKQTRPASDAIREALFSSLGALIPGIRVLDLFAGTGSYGLEALSRGAAHVEWVESDARCIACIKENLKRVVNSCEREDCESRILRADVLKWAPNESGSWDIAIADPPYDAIPLVEGSLFALMDRALTADGLVVLEKPAGLEISPSDWQEVKRLGKKRGSGPSLSLWKRA